MEDDISKLKRIFNGAKVIRGSGDAIYLDSLAAYAIQQAIKSHADTGLTALDKEFSRADSRLVDNWQSTHVAAKKVGKDLSENEVMSALSIGNASKGELYTKPSTELKKQKQKIKEISNSFRIFDSTFSSRIQKRVDDDIELSTWFNH